MLLPMLGVYQEYVRNHHYSLQVLAEYKMKKEFNKMLKRCEEKSQCEGRSIESFLTCPMYQVCLFVIGFFKDFFFKKKNKKYFFLMSRFHDTLLHCMKYLHIHHMSMWIELI